MFKNQVIIVTGAGNGIGRATALAFSEHGAKVVVNDVNEAAIMETTALIEQQGGGGSSCCRRYLTKSKSERTR